jgi:hypothetical protein
LGFGIVPTEWYIFFHFIENKNVTNVK